MTTRQGPTRIVAPALPADFARLGEECQELEKAGVDALFSHPDGRSAAVAALRAAAEEGNR